MQLERRGVLHSGFSLTCLHSRTTFSIIKTYHCWPHLKEHYLHWTFWHQSTQQIVGRCDTTPAMRCSTGLTPCHMWGFTRPPGMYRVCLLSSARCNLYLFSQHCTVAWSDCNRVQSMLCTWNESWRSETRLICWDFCSGDDVKAAMNSLHTGFVLPIINFHNASDIWCKLTQPE